MINFTPKLSGQAQNQSS